MPKFGSEKGERKNKGGRRKVELMEKIDIKEVNNKIDEITIKIRESEKKKESLKILYTPFKLFN